MHEQITSRVIMVRPKHFSYNEETAENNAFQEKNIELTTDEVSEQAIVEFDAMVDKMRSKGIDVTVWEDTDKPYKPDAVFPNNWFTTHDDNSIVTFPIFSPNRRLERREELLDTISDKNTKRYCFEYYEEDDKFLEGTGSMILDRQNRIVYACLSERTEIEILEKFSILKEFRKVYFDAVDQDGDPIYHTNVMMAVGEEFCIICLDSIKNETERNDVEKNLKNTGKTIIPITYQQINSFAGNMIQLKNANGDKFILMSKQAFESLGGSQVTELENHGELLVVDIQTIEVSGGGSARCMVAENFLPH